MILNETYALSNGVRIPKLGLGTWFIEDDKAAQTVRDAVAIGVSNFEQHDIENILKACTVTPHVNQLLVHAGNTPAELITYCRDKNILVEAYSPIAHGEILKNPDVAVMADRYGMTVPQLCI